jgi:ABC-type multidrug transport system ATPase subunit
VTEVLSHGDLRRKCVVLSECAGEIPVGGVTAIMGLSGGKTTLMKIVAGRKFGPGIARH